MVEGFHGCMVLWEVTLSEIEVDQGRVPTGASGPGGEQPAEGRLAGVGGADDEDVGARGFMGEGLGAASAERVVQGEVGRHRGFVGDVGERTVGRVGGQGHGRAFPRVDGDVLVAEGELLAEAKLGRGAWGGRGIRGVGG